MWRRFYDLQVEIANSNTGDVFLHSFPRVDKFQELPYTLRHALKAIGAPRITQYCTENKLTADDDVYFTFIFKNIGVRVYMESNGYEIQDIFRLTLEKGPTRSSVM